MKKRPTLPDHVEGSEEPLQKKQHCDKVPKDNCTQRLHKIINRLLDFSGECINADAKKKN